MNGPGKAREAESRLACGDYAVIFRQGELVKRVPVVQATKVLIEASRVLVWPRAHAAVDVAFTVDRHRWKQTRHSTT